jgi:hypothetical protein
MARPGMSHTAVARLARVARSVVSVAVSAGLIDLLPNGRIDPDGPATRTYIASHAPGEACTGASGVAAKVAAFAAKARLLQQRLDEQEATLVERAICLRVNLDHVPMVRAWLAGIPERRREQLATATGCSIETARGVLDELILRITEELGDMAAEVTEAILAA